MELWIRSQDRMKLCNAKVFSLDNDQTGIFCNSCEDSYVFAGKYKTKERALEVLDEIAAMIENRYIVKPAGIISTKDIAREHMRLTRLYYGKFIIENPPFEIVPINSNTIYYEMPKD